MQHDMDKGWSKPSRTVHHQSILHEWKDILYSVEGVDWHGFHGVMVFMHVAQIFSV